MVSQDQTTNGTVGSACKCPREKLLKRFSHSNRVGALAWYRIISVISLWACFGHGIYPQSIPFPSRRSSVSPSVSIELALDWSPYSRLKRTKAISLSLDTWFHPGWPWPLHQAFFKPSSLYRYSCLLGQPKIAPTAMISLVAATLIVAVQRTPHTLARAKGLVIFSSLPLSLRLRRYRDRKACLIYAE
jgi:hypothetical protein